MLAADRLGLIADHLEVFLVGFVCGWVVLLVVAHLVARRRREPLTIIGVEMPGLPEGWVPIEVVAAIKCVSDRGGDSMAVRASEGLNQWEAIGMLRAGEAELTARLRRRMNRE